MKKEHANTASNNSSLYKTIRHYLVTFLLGIFLAFLYSNRNDLVGGHLKLAARTLQASKNAIDCAQMAVLKYIPVTERNSIAPKHVWSAFEESSDDLDAVYSLHGCPANRYTMRLISRDPMIVYFENFLSPAEIEHVLKIGVPKLAPSTVVSDDGNAVSDIRTSYSAYLTRAEDAVIQCIEARAAAIQGSVPLHNMEPLQLVRYNSKQQYKAHYDWFPNNTEGDRQELAKGGQRTTSFFVYLQANCTGGETAFTNIFLSKEALAPFCDVVVCDESSYKNPKPHIASGSVEVDEISRGLRVIPKVGNAVFWYNTNIKGFGDVRTIHSGLPLFSGQKIAMNIWTRQGEFV